ncbi:hypothetical protein EON67_01960 [archaeon]|nr:MAG: hypothetical protein EON67_01960 [archaeon]
MPVYADLNLVLEGAAASAVNRVAAFAAAAMKCTQLQLQLHLTRPRARAPLPRSPCLPRAVASCSFACSGLQLHCRQSQCHAAVATVRCTSRPRRGTRVQLTFNHFGSLWRDMSLSSHVYSHVCGCARARACVCVCVCR